MTCDRLLTVSEGGLECARCWNFLDWRISQECTYTQMRRCFRLSKLYQMIIAFDKHALEIVTRKSFLKDWAGYAEEMKTPEGETTWHTQSLFYLWHFLIQDVLTLTRLLIYLYSLYTHCLLIVYCMYNIVLWWSCDVLFYVRLAIDSCLTALPGGFRLDELVKQKEFLRLKHFSSATL